MSLGAVEFSGSFLGRVGWQVRLTHFHLSMLSKHTQLIWENKEPPSLCPHHPSLAVNMGSCPKLSANPNSNMHAVGVAAAAVTVASAVTPTARELEPQPVN